MLVQEEKKNLSGRIADEILEMITVKKRFQTGDKLPNENEFSFELGVSRTTLREAVRILAAHNVLEIRRGLGTFVAENEELTKSFGLEKLSALTVNLKDLYEIRLILEPEIAFFAAKRGTEKEIEAILFSGLEVERKITEQEDRTEQEMAFHTAIAKASHNAFIYRLMPIIHSSIYSGVLAGKENQRIKQETITDHRMLMDFIKERNPEGAKTAMKLHILHAVTELAPK